MSMSPPTPQVKYKEQYEKTKGRMVGVKGVSEDSQLAHAAWASRLQSDREYRQRYKDSQTVYSVPLDMMALSQARKAQDLATDTSYRSVLHQYTSLPTDMAVTWARKAYDLQSDVSPTHTGMLALAISCKACPTDRVTLWPVSISAEHTGGYPGMYADPIL